MLQCDICGVTSFDMGLINGKYYCVDCFLLEFSNVMGTEKESVTVEVNEDEEE